MARGNPSSPFPRSLKPGGWDLIGCAVGYAGQPLRAVGKTALRGGDHVASLTGECRHGRLEFRVGRG